VVCQTKRMNTGSILAHVMSKKHTSLAKAYKDADARKFARYGSAPEEGSTADEKSVNRSIAELGGIASKAAPILPCSAVAPGVNLHSVDKIVSEVMSSENMDLLVDGRLNSGIADDGRGFFWCRICMTKHMLGKPQVQLHLNGRRHEAALLGLVKELAPIAGKYGVVREQPDFEDRSSLEYFVELVLRAKERGGTPRSGSFVLSASPHSSHPSGTRSDYQQIESEATPSRVAAAVRGKNLNHVNDAKVLHANGAKRVKLLVDGRLNSGIVPHGKGFVSCGICETERKTIMREDCTEAHLNSRRHRAILEELARSLTRFADDYDVNLRFPAADSRSAFEEYVECILQAVEHGKSHRCNGPPFPTSLSRSETPALCVKPREIQHIVQSPKQSPLAPAAEETLLMEDDAWLDAPMTLKDWKELEQHSLGTGEADALAFKTVRDTFLSPVGAESTDLALSAGALRRPPIWIDSKSGDWVMLAEDLRPVENASEEVSSSSELMAFKRVQDRLESSIDPFALNEHSVGVDEDGMGSHGRLHGHDGAVTIREGQRGRIYCDISGGGLSEACLHSKSTLRDPLWLSMVRHELKTVIECAAAYV
jgi:hypothetical protein